MSQDRTIEQFLHDMRDTVDGVGRLVAETDRETFMTTHTGSWAIERGIIQLGEIASQLRNRHGDYVEAHPELDPPGMRSARNIVVHGYATIDRARIWQIVVEKVPTVGDAADSLLRELGKHRGAER
ncbi:MAG: DUF86 domain-containing protein [Actinomycetota bacterium]|nr:DUF86 domain-containing protein [Actinomycetota bacterium]